MSGNTRELAVEVIGGCVATRIRLATRVVTRLYDDALRPFGVTVSQMALLAVAAEDGAIRQSEVGARLHLDDSTVSRNLERMRAKGWLEDVAEHDARVHTYRLTDSGHALFEQIIPAWRVAQRRAIELFDEAGVASLHRFARKTGFGD